MYCWIVYLSQLYLFLIFQTRKYDNGEDPLGVCSSLPPVPKENENKKPCRVTPPGRSSSPMPDGRKTFVINLQNK